MFLLILALWSMAGVQGYSQTPAEATSFDKVKELADKGSAQAQLDLARRYAAGEGVKRDEGKAFKWCKKAAEQDLAEAQFDLAWQYVNGAGVKEDEEEGWVEHFSSLEKISQLVIHMKGELA